MTTTVYLTPNSGPRPTLSACMIVKNEEKFLAQCLESIKNAVDEIIIVDTGSTDSTVEIAKRYTDKVYFHAWNHSFSEARNVSLSYATCDWILQIDADETLEAEDIPLLHACLQSDLYDAVMVAIYNLFDSTRSKHYFQRVFRRGFSHFEGIVHNQLVTRGEVASSEIRLYHYGYNLASGDMQKKYERTRQLLLRQISEDPDNAFARMNLLRVYRAQTKWAETVEAGRAALERNSPSMSSDQSQMIRGDMAYAHFSLGQYAEAEAVCRSILSDNDRNLDALFTLGGVHMERAEYAEAIHCYKRFLEIKREEDVRPRYSALIVDTYTFEDKAYNNIGEAYRRLGLTDKAIEAYQTAIARNNAAPEAYHNLGTYLTQLGRPAEAEAVFGKAIALGIATTYIWYWAGELARRAGRLDEAARAYHEAVAKSPDNVDANHGLAVCLLQMGKLEEAGQIIEQAASRAPTHIGVMVSRAHILAALGKPDEVVACLDQIAALNPPDNALRYELAQLLIQIGRFPLAVPMLEQYLSQAPEDAAALTDLATCYVRMGHVDAALVGYRAALQLRPGYAPAARNLRFLLEQKAGSGQA